METVYPVLEPVCKAALMRGEFKRDNFVDKSSVCGTGGRFRNFSEIKANVGAKS